MQPVRRLVCHVHYSRCIWWSTLQLLFAPQDIDDLVIQMRVNGVDWMMQKKERRRNQGKEVKNDDKYSGRKRSVGF